MEKFIVAIILARTYTLASNFLANPRISPAKFEDYQESLAKRLSLDQAQSSQKEEKYRSAAPALVDAYARWKGRRKADSATPQAQVREFCTSSYKAISSKGCTWGDANHLVAWEESRGSNSQSSSSSSSSMRKEGEVAATHATDTTLRQSYPALGVISCQRVKGVPTASEFLRKYVAASQPVIFEDIAKDWKARDSWSMDYLVENAGSTIVKGYVSADGDFERIQRVGDWNALATRLGAEVVTLMQEDGAISDEEPILVRPAETEMSLEHFSALLMRRVQNEQHLSQRELYGNLTYYLCKHPLEKWRTISILQSDLTPSIHSQPGLQEEGQNFSKFLLPLHHLLWLGRGWTRGPIHYDEQENLHTVLRGTKTFEIFHPLDSQNLYEESAHFYSSHLLYEHDQERGHRVYRLPLAVTGKKYQPFSPVNISHPDMERHPNHRKARKLTCEVKAGETLFLPSYWFHEVTSLGEDSSENIAIGINNFFMPWFQRASQRGLSRTFESPSFSLNPAYSHLHGEIRSRPEDDLDYWNNYVGTLDATERVVIKGDSHSEPVFDEEETIWI